MLIDPFKGKWTVKLWSKEVISSYRQGKKIAADKQN